MGNYSKIEIDFIERTIELIEQYCSDLEKYPFEKQFNHTLVINCMLGLIIMPKEKAISYIPNERLITKYKNKIGLQHTVIHEDIKTLRELIKRLRHSVAHFSINVISEDENNRIDWIEFVDNENGGKVLARFKESEILTFLKHYTSFLVENMKKYM
jgi:hypothetical protein